MHTSKISVKFLAFALLVLLSNSVSAQRHDRELEKKRSSQQESESVKEKDTRTGFSSKLWYGGGVNIGFSGSNGYSTFNFGLSPMVGYKITKKLSVGPRLAYDLFYLKVVGSGNIALNSFDLGAFMRFRVFRGLFLQGELSNQWYQETDLVSKYSNQRFNQRLGAGYSFGEPGGVSSEISVLFNFKVANDLYTYQNPFEYRFGFTWFF